MKPEIWIGLAVAFVAFLWYLLRPWPCYTCRVRPACIAIGDHWVCRKCWNRLEAIRRVLSDENAAPNEIEAYEAYMRERGK